MSQSLVAYLDPKEDAAPEAAPSRDASAYPRDLDALHARLVRWFEEAERSSLGGRALSERDRAYVCGDPWTPAERAALKARHQPETTINQCSRKIQRLCGMERKARTDPKAFPNSPTEDERADAATQM